MRMKCEIIQDLIPVYYDGIASDATYTEVRLHLKNCPECRQYYTQYRHSMQMELATDTAFNEPASDSFASLSRRVRRRKLLSTASVTAIAAVAAAAIVYSACREIQRMTNE